MERFLRAKDSDVVVLAGPTGEGYCGHVFPQPYLKPRKPLAFLFVMFLLELVGRI